jgi:hypothetical protein
VVKYTEVGGSSNCWAKNVERQGGALTKQTDKNGFLKTLAAKLSQNGNFEVLVAKKRTKSMLFGMLAWDTCW